MAIGRTNAGGGSGGGLNFKVVGGTTAPTSPKKNTIWINTDEPITSWAFSTTEPENPVEGMVWIITGTTSTVEFNALKKNSLQVYPLEAKQYVGGAWVAKVAMTYQGGEWISWIRYLYAYGDECEDLTGGWESLPYISTSSESTRKALTLEKNKTSITASNNASYGGSVWSGNAIDLTDVETLSINVTEATNVSDKMTFGIHKTKGNYTAWDASVVILDTGEYSVDVSEMSGSFYVVFSIVAVAKSVTIDKIWMQ